MTFVIPFGTQSLSEAHVFPNLASAWSVNAAETLTQSKNSRSSLEWQNDLMEVGSPPDCWRVQHVGHVATERNRSRPAFSSPSNKRLVAFFLTHSQDSEDRLSV